MAQGTEAVGALLERDAELDAMTRAFEGAVAGTGSVLVIEGAAGVGKSALMREFGARVAPARLLTAVGGELEREFPYGLVRQLLEPVVRGAGPERREQLLSGAAALAAPIVGGESAGDAETGDASYAVLHGLYWLVATLAEDEPLVLVVDDLHWGDTPSLRFFDFLGRRVEDLPLLVAVGLRPQEPNADWALLDSIAGAASSTVLRPNLLSEEAVSQMVTERLEGAGPDTTAAAHETTGGNPLLLRELMRSLKGDAVTPEAVRAAVPSTVTRSVRRRLEALPEGARALAAALAVLEDGQGGALAGEVAGQSEREVGANLATLRAADLVQENDTRFLHPLIRDAVGGSVSAHERDRLHQAAATALRGRPDAEDQLLLHLLAASPMGERWTVDLLRNAAARAIAEGAPEAAARRLRRAIEEGGATDELTLDLGLAELRAGHRSAMTPLARAAESEDPIISARALQATLALTSLSGEADVPRMVEQLLGALEALPDDSEEGSRVAENLRATLLNMLTIELSLVERRVEFVFAAANDESAVVAGARAFELASRRGTSAEIVALCERALRDRPFTDVRWMEAHAATWSLAAGFLVDDAAELAAATLRDAEAAASRHGSPQGRAATLQHRAEWEMQWGSAATAEVLGRESAEVFAHYDQQISWAAMNGTLAEAVAVLGRLDEAEELLAEVERPSRPTWIDAIPHQALGRLRLAQGRWEEAVMAYRLVQDVADAHHYRRYSRGHSGVDLAMALALAGHRDEAIAAATEEVEVGEQTGRATLLLGGLTALGMARGGEEGLAILLRATEQAERSRSPFRRAIAFVEAGAALRRAGRRKDAREPLRRGVEEAHRADARLLQERAEEELVVAGGRQRTPYSSGVESLTPSERRVAELAAEGLTNRQIAEMLFVTQKTVEVHLGHSYGKLEIRSRTQLARALGGAVGTND